LGSFVLALFHILFLLGFGAYQYTIAEDDDNNVNALNKPMTRKN